MNLTKFQRTSLLGVTLFLLVFSFSGCAPITSLRLDDPYMAKTDKIQYELNRFFKPEEIFEYKQASFDFIYACDEY